MDGTPITSVSFANPPHIVAFFVFAAVVGAYVTARFPPAVIFMGTLLSLWRIHHHRRRIILGVANTLRRAEEAAHKLAARC